MVPNVGCTNPASALPPAKTTSQAPCECSLGTCSGWNPTSTPGENDLNPNWLSPGATKDAVGTRGPWPVFKGCGGPRHPSPARTATVKHLGWEGAGRQRRDPCLPPAPARASTEAGVSGTRERVSPRIAHQHLPHPPSLPSPSPTQPALARQLGCEGSEITRRATERAERRGSFWRQRRDPSGGHVVLGRERNEALETVRSVQTRRQLLGRYRVDLSEHPESWPRPSTQKRILLTWAAAGHPLPRYAPGRLAPEGAGALPFTGGGLATAPRPNTSPRGNRRSSNTVQALGSNHPGVPTGPCILTGGAGEGPGAHLRRDSGSPRAGCKWSGCTACIRSAFAAAPAAMGPGTPAGRGPRAERSAGVAGAAACAVTLAAPPRGALRWIWAHCCGRSTCTGGAPLACGRRATPRSSSWTRSTRTCGSRRS